MPQLFRVLGKLDSQSILEVVRRIKGGKIVAYPTDTVYGLGTNALDSRAVQRIFQAKNRSLELPLSVAVSGIAMAQRIAFLNQRAQLLMKAFWPGALTLIVRKKAVIPSIVTSGADKVGLRAPRHEIPLSIIRHSKVPIISTSANKHGEPPCINVDCIRRTFGESIDVIIDGGRGSLLASTVINVTAQPPIIVRKGPITRTMIERVIGSVTLDTE